jgi:hypothetical protein
MLVLYGVDLLALCLIQKLEDHPSSDVHDYLFNIFVAGCAMQW